MRPSRHRECRVGGWKARKAATLRNGATQRPLVPLKSLETDSPPRGLVSRLTHQPSFFLGLEFGRSPSHAARVLPTARRQCGPWLEYSGWHHLDQCSNLGLMTSKLCGICLSFLNYKMELGTDTTFRGHSVCPTPCPPDSPLPALLPRRLTSPRLEVRGCQEERGQGVSTRPLHGHSSGGQHSCPGAPVPHLLLCWVRQRCAHLLPLHADKCLMLPAGIGLWVVLTPTGSLTPQHTSVKNPFINLPR